jgi:hypothetical protein
VKSIRPDAGPPDKVLTYLEQLAALSCALRAGPLRRTVVRWLTERGVHASSESDSIKRSPAEKRKRTWADAGGDRRFFDLHLKPSDCTSVDRCVRIYFAWDGDLEKVVVGWVGRHPG